MSMDKRFVVCHYVELESKLSRNLFNKLYDDLTDKFFIPEGMENIILSNFRGSRVKSNDSYDAFSFEVTSDLISEKYVQFTHEMKPIINFLEKENIKYTIKFGCVQYYI